jgi:hypothetical protein
MESIAERTLFLLIKNKEVDEHDQCHKNVFAPVRRTGRNMVQHPGACYQSCQLPAKDRKPIINGNNEDLLPEH